MFFSNCLNNFKKAHPNFRVEPFSSENLPKIRELVDAWYEIKGEDASSIEYEKQVFDRAIDNFEDLGLEGLVLLDNEEVLAVTFASRMDDITFDVHFEKARRDIDGAYVVINNEFAKYIKAKYPEIKFLNREEDMGVEGLRKSILRMQAV